jgi:hypothetical protein
MLGRLCLPEELLSGSPFKVLWLSRFPGAGYNQSLVPAARRLPGPAGEFERSFRGVD